MHTNSPGLGRLSGYIWKQAQERVIRPLFNPHAAQRLKDLDGIRAVDFSIHEPHKIAQTRNRGMLGSLLPRTKVPSIAVSASVGQRRPHDAYLDDELAAEVFKIADSAENFFDRIIVPGLSKTEKTPTGKQRSVEISLLSERLQEERTLDSDGTVPAPELRGTTYAQIGESAGVTLGVSLTVLAIMFALPERPAVKDIRNSDTWPLLQGMLLAIGLLVLVAMTSARIGSATDRNRTPTMLAKPPRRPRAMRSRATALSRQRP
jgi:hypothetical protein